MRIDKSLKLIVIASVLSMMTACGGGGSSGGAGSAGSTTTPSAVPPPYTLGQSTITASYVVDTGNALQFQATKNSAFSGTAYLKLSFDQDAFKLDGVAIPNQDGSFYIGLYLPKNASPGRHIGKITVNACQDAECAVHIPGSPFTVPYDITAIPLEGIVTQYNLSALSPIAGAPEWETFQGNAGHTGFVPVTLNAASFKPRWKWDTPSRGGRQLSPSDITTSGGRMFFAFDHSIGNKESYFSLEAYCESNASKVWSHDFGNTSFSSTSPPAVIGNIVYENAGAQSDNAMYAFDASNGTQLFRSQLGAQWDRFLAPTIKSGVVYSGGLYGVDAMDGARKLLTPLGLDDGWTPAIDDNYLYAYVGGYLKVINRQNGEVVKIIADPSYSWNGYTPGGAPVLGANGNVFAGNLSNSRENSIVNFDTKAGKVNWVAKGNFSGNPAYASGVLYGANNTPFALEARNEADGAVLWWWIPAASDSRFVSNVIVTNNLVFVATETTTYAIDLRTHLPVWTYPASGRLALSANGVLYIKSANAITAINLH